MIRFRRIVYLDNNATTIVSPAVAATMSRCLRHCHGNPSSLYRTARDSAAILEESRFAIARAINAQPHEIYFTSCATEANNTVLKSLAEKHGEKKSHIIASPIEHASVATTLEYLAAKGFAVEYLPVDKSGVVNPADLERMVTDKTLVVCCMLANNEIGTIQDIQTLARIAHKKGVPLMCDCVQGLGKIAVDVKALEIDYGSFSAHKIHGPKGIGIVYVKEGGFLSPLIHGGHQEYGIRAGTEGVHNIAGFAAACEALPLMCRRAPQVARLRDMLVQGIKGIKGDVHVNSPQEPCLPNTASITFPGQNNASLMAMLDYHGIAVSAGSACNTQDDKPSHVLTAIGLSDAEARQTLRFSLSTDTGETDVRYVLKVLEDHLEGKSPPVGAVMPRQLDENLLLHKDTFVLDVRFWYDRRMLKGLPNSHEIPFFTFYKYVGKLPRDKNIIAVCQVGYNAPIVAYFLKRKGFKQVNFLMTGLMGWKLAHPDLYRRLAGKNIVKI